MSSTSHLRPPLDASQWDAAPVDIPGHGRSGRNPLSPLPDAPPHNTRDRTECTRVSRGRDPPAPRTNSHRVSSVEGRGHTDTDQILVYFLLRAETRVSPTCSNLSILI